jgi:antitoxin ParD1/3/4
MTITLQPPMDRLIAEKVQTGRYSSADQLVRQALEHELAGDEVNEWMRACAAEGFAQLDAGAAVEMNRDDFMQWLHQRRTSPA